MGNETFLACVSPRADHYHSGLDSAQALRAETPGVGGGSEDHSAPTQGKGKGEEPMETGPQEGGGAYPVGGRALPLGLQRAVLADLL